MIMGAGAIGSLFGGLIADAGYDVTLVGRRAHVDVVNERGLRISGIMEKKIEVVAKTEPIEADIVFLTVKSYDTEEATRSIPIKRDTVVVSLQNGLGNIDKMVRILGIERVVGGVTSHGALFVSPGHIKHTGTGRTLIGGLVKDKKDERVAEILNDANVKTDVVEDITQKIWEKLIVNVGINAPTALTGIKNGELLLYPEMRWVMTESVEEANRVAKKIGIDGISIEDVEDITRKTAENESSMLQDVKRGKRTEIDAINGVIVRIGRENGIDTPVNRTLYTLIKTIERSPSVNRQIISRLDQR